MKCNRKMSSGSRVDSVDTRCALVSLHTTLQGGDVITHCPAVGPGCDGGKGFARLFSVTGETSSPRRYSRTLRTISQSTPTFPVTHCY